jgi:nuclear transport factor 2 (NTF2) superfamily protein
MPRNWTPEEDAVLKREALRQCEINLLVHLQWTFSEASILILFYSEYHKDCRKRWFNEVTGGLKKGPWDKDEDARLRNGIQKYGYKYDFTGILMHT